jgi:hypothetical protein
LWKLKKREENLILRTLVCINRKNEKNGDQQWRMPLKKLAIVVHLGALSFELGLQAQRFNPKQKSEEKNLSIHVLIRNQRRKQNQSMPENAGKVFTIDLPRSFEIG